MVVQKAARKTQEAYLRRLAVVFAAELRLKIVTELYMREMSPTQFFEEFGGGSVSRVDRHFQRLAETRWLRLVRTATGGSRRGGVEHFYRATDLAVFDDETWSLLPYSIRVTFSGTIFKQFAERVQEALEAGTFDSRPDRHFTWTPLWLDELGWERVVAAVDELFESLAEEQADARLRVFQSGEATFLATVALAAFESPSRAEPVREVAPSLAETALSPIPLTFRLSKVFGDPVCLKIVSEANLREMSAPLFHAEFGEDSVSGIRRRFKMLAQTGWLKKVSEKTGGRRRGAVEHFYRATGPAVFDSCTWSNVPDAVKTTYSWRIFQQLSEQIELASRVGTFDTRPDRHLTWSLLRLDQLGWEKVITAVDSVFLFIFKEQESAKRRMERSGELPVRATVALAAFESPREAEKAP